MNKDDNSDLIEAWYGVSTWRGAAISRAICLWFYWITAFWTSRTGLAKNTSSIRAVDWHILIGWTSTELELIVQ